MKFFIGIFLSITLLIVLGVGAWWSWKRGGLNPFPSIAKSEALVKPNPENYEIIVADLNRWRRELSATYANAKSEAEKKQVEQDARIILEFLLPKMMNCWLGTEYDFNGTAEKPGAGKLACGYFVSTVIQDAGFRVNRYTLAQQASENILCTFLSKDYCRLTVDQSFDAFFKDTQKKQNGIYLIGLDSHVGFLVKTGSEVHFYHSSKWKDRGVINESGQHAYALKNSSWRMIGDFTADPQVIRTWLSGNEIKVRI